MAENALKVSGLSKKFMIGNSTSGNLREEIIQFFNRKPRGLEEYWALKEVSFEVPKGQSVGIIGRNGAGKSTLLKVLSRIIHPTTGTVEIDGRVASLLEVGTGFHPELTGRENIYLNGTILGMSRKEIKSRFDEIVEFSGIERFIDTPVKRYSSGMFVRLAFSVAAHIEPEILIIDEVLAVGDAEFQKKCLGKMDEVTHQGRTVLFVSHNMALIQNLCQRVIFLSQGRIKYSGDPKLAIEKYLAREKSNSRILINDSNKWNSFTLDRYDIVDDAGDSVDFVYVGMEFGIRFYYQSEYPINELIIRLQIVNHHGHVVTTLNNYHSSQPFENLPESGTLTCRILKNPLLDGGYQFNVLILVDREEVLSISNQGEIEVHNGDFFGTGKIPDVKEGVLVDHYWSADG